MGLMARQGLFTYSWLQWLMGRVTTFPEVLPVRSQVPSSIPGSPRVIVEEPLSKTLNPFFPSHSHVIAARVNRGELLWGTKPDTHMTTTTRFKIRYILPAKWIWFLLTERLSFWSCLTWNHNILPHISSHSPTLIDNTVKWSPYRTHNSRIPP